jgi:hypothetical protein
MRNGQESHETTDATFDSDAQVTAQSEETSPADDRYRAAGLRELAYRVDGGVEVTLLWDAHENGVAVTVSDMRSGDWFVLHPENDKALEVFYHPYAYAPLKADEPREQARKSLQS